MNVLLLLMIAANGPEIETGSISGPNDELRSYLSEAAENNPALHERYEQWHAAVERVPQVKSLDDPMLAFGYFVQSNINRFKFNLAQKFPSFGTLRARGNKAAAEADAALARFYALRNRIFADVKNAYFEYAFLAQSIRVTDAQNQIMDYMEEIVRSKYSLGVAREGDLLRVQIEKTQVRDRYDSLLNIRPASSAKLAEALGREPREDLPWPQQAKLPSRPPEFSQLVEQLRTSNPDLQALDYDIRGSQEQTKLAKKKGVPDLTVMLDYTTISRPRKIRPDRPFPSSLQGLRRLATGTSAGLSGTLIDAYAVGVYDEPISSRSSGDDNVLLSFRINVPIWRKRIKASISEAKFRTQAAEHRKYARELSLEAVAKAAVFGVKDGLRRVDLYEDSLLPQAKQTFESIQSAYATGDTGADFLDLLDSVRLLLQFELDQLRAVRDSLVAAAELEFILGGPWSSPDRE